MNSDNILDTQIAEALIKRPTLDQLSRYVAGLATPIQAELIEAHLQKSPGVCMDVEALRQEFQEFGEALEESMRMPARATSTEGIDLPAYLDNEKALAASEGQPLEEVIFLERVQGVIPGIEGEACASTEAPDLCSTLRIAWVESECLIPSGIQVSWPTGKRLSRPMERLNGEWRVDIVIPEPWSKVSSWLNSGRVTFSA